MTVEEVQVLVTARTQGLQNQMNELTRRLQGVQRQTNTMSNNMIKTFSKLKSTLVALGIGKAIAGAFNLAKTYEASVQQVNRLFGLYSGALDAWIEKNAKTFGMARADAMKYASVYGNLLSGFVASTSQMEKYTEELLKSSAIIASSTGRTMEDVMERIRSGLLGNTEAIEDLGVNVNVALLKTTNAFKQLSNGKSWDQLSFQTQQQIRLMAILEQTSAKFGDSIQNNMNYKLMQLTASLKDIWLNLGQAFLPIVNAVLPILNAMATALANVTAKLAAFMNALFGTKFHQGAGVEQVGVSANNAAGGFGNMADGAKEAGKEAEKAAKKAKAALAPFDELNVLSKDNSSDKGGSGSGGLTSDLGSTVTPVTNKLEEASQSFADKLKAELERLKELFKTGFEIGLGNGWENQVEDIRESIDGIKTSLKDIFTDPEVVNGTSSLIDGITLNIGKATGSITSVGTTIAQNILGGIDKYLEENTQFIRDRLVGIFNASEEIANIVGNFTVAIADIFSVFGNEDAQQITANIIGIFSNGFLGSLQLAIQYSKDILRCIVEPIEQNKDAIKLALENTFKPIETITGILKDLVTNTFKSILKAYEEYIEPAFDNISEGISKIVEGLLDAYNTHIAPTIDNIADKWHEFYEEHLQPVIDKAIDVLGKLVLAVSELWNNCLAPFVAWVIKILGPEVATAFENISEAFKTSGEIILGIVDSLLTVLDGLIDFIVGIFTGDWKKSWEGIKAIFKGIVDTFEALTKDPIDKALEWIKGSFTRSWTTAWNNVKTVFGTAFNGLKTLAKTPLNYIIDLINNAIRGINKITGTVNKIPGVSIGSIPEIPKLAKGGVLRQSTIVEVGEYAGARQNPEIVTPQNIMYDTVVAANAELASSFFQAARMIVNAIENKDTNVVIGDETIGRSSVNYINKQTKLKGVSPIQI